LLLPDLAEHTDQFFTLLHGCFNVKKDEARRAGKSEFVFMGLWKCSVHYNERGCTMNPDHTTRLMCNEIKSAPEQGYVRLVNIIAKPPVFMEYLDNIQLKALSMSKVYPVVLQYKPDLSTLYQLVFVNIFDLMLRQGVDEFVADGLGTFNTVDVKHGQSITFHADAF
jgi:hypothetical protein